MITTKAKLYETDNLLFSLSEHQIGQNGGDTRQSWPWPGGSIAIWSLDLPQTLAFFAGYIFKLIRTPMHVCNLFHASHILSSMCCISLRSWRFSTWLSQHNKRPSTRSCKSLCGLLGDCICSNSATYRHKEP